MVRVAERLHGANIPYVAVTNARESPMASMSEVTIQVAGESDEGISIRTYTGAALTLLYLSAERVNEGKSLHSEALSMVDSLGKKMGDWEAIGASIEDARFFSFLGRGYSLSCACEASLLFQELARRPANWSSGAEFRQGPIEVLQSGDAVFVFAPDGPTRHLNAALIDELRLTGARVTEIGPPWSSIPEHLAAVSLIIPAQFAAYYLALRNANNPGNFRFASLTTENECNK
jgi:glucosamine--fructose-6-phosphate aminotransferase (isomerizing)